MSWEWLKGVFNWSPKLSKAADAINDGAAGVNDPDDVPAVAAPVRLDADAEKERGTMATQLTADLSDEFFTKLVALAKRRNLDASSLLMVFNYESGLRSTAHNPAGAWGIGQIMSFNLPHLGWTGTPEDYLQLPADMQLDYEDRYFAPYTNDHLDSVERIYQANFLPATLGWGSDPSTVLVNQVGGGARWNPHWGSEAGVYAQNASFDHDHKGYITVGDLGVRARAQAAASPRFQEALSRLQAAGGGGGGMLSAAASLGPAGGIAVVLVVAGVAAAAISRLE